MSCAHDSRVLSERLVVLLTLLGSCGLPTCTAVDSACFDDGPGLSEVNLGVCCHPGSVHPCFDAVYTRSRCCHGFQPADLRPLIRALTESLSAHSDWFRLVQGSNLRRDVLLAHLARALNLTGDFVELGVQEGIFAARMLDRLRELSRSPRLYWLVDLWQKSFLDDDPTVYKRQRHASMQAKLVRQTTLSVEQHWKKVRLLQLATVQAARLFNDGSVDFVYVDAQHDYCGVLDDLQAWWPKLRVGGVMAGDDYGTHGSKWRTCSNGTNIPGSVQRAVNDFFGLVGDRGSSVADYFMIRNQWVVLKGSAVHFGGASTSM
eukprot:TRINITY_DN21701_c0_g1_i1.p1 TRINITY_DN21701_c0_g1~~TRINITY_DN21701_c0_g1_i1.p1  ORF type:complete len:318 (-),score=40.37 TRINITY_DN21701_c0_g1_i1:31-984(-)